MMLLASEMKRSFNEIRTYFINYIFMNLNMLFMMIGIVIGLELVYKSTEIIHTFFIGILVWRITVISIESLSTMLQSEIRMGTLEQLLMSRSNLTTILISRLLVNIILEVLTLCVVLTISLIILGVWVDFTKMINLKVIIVLMMAVTGATGFGLISAGASLIFKKADAVARTTTNIILFFSGLIIPIQVISEKYLNYAKIFPFYWARIIILDSYSEISFSRNSSQLACMIALSIIWLLIGRVVFYSATSAMFEKGSSNQY